MFKLYWERSQVPDNCLLLNFAKPAKLKKFKHLNYVSFDLLPCQGETFKRESKKNTLQRERGYFYPLRPGQAGPHKMQKSLLNQ